MYCLGCTENRGLWPQSTFTCFGSSTLDKLKSLDKFLAGVQARAYRMAQIATSNSEEALDLVQDAMFKLVEKYSDRQENEWAPLFYRILQSRINDWHRRNSVRNRFRSWLSPRVEDGEDPIQTAPDPHSRSPEEET
ncbi:MAG TPA: sigma factor [Gammaproteobacteria bacterium]|nr:sigma factor [Gammaproteobacteria bacterium]